MSSRLSACLWVLSVALFSSVIAGPEAAAADVEYKGWLYGRVLVQEDAGIDLEVLEWVGSLLGDGWETSFNATIVRGIWDSLAFNDIRRLGPLELETLTRFDPETSGFEYLESIIMFSAWDVDIRNNAYVSNSPTQSYDQLVVTGTTGTTAWRGEANVGLCPFEFRSIWFEGSSTWPSCGLQVRATIAFSQTAGFDHFILSATYPRVPFLSFGVLETDLTLTLEFNPQGKRVTPELRTRVLNTTACITPLLEFETTDDPFTIAGIVAYGLRWECSLADSVSLYGATSLTPGKNAELTGSSEFFETFGFRVPLPSCCAEDGFIRIDVFFDEDSSSLMDWGSLKASIDMPFGRRLRLTLGIDHRPKTPHWTFLIGGKVLF